MAKVIYGSDDHLVNGNVLTIIVFLATCRPRVDGVWLRRRLLAAMLVMLYMDSVRIGINERGK